MHSTLFKKVEYHLGTLVNSIDTGEIGLPDIQRPFVWKNLKVRDLFDSMYRGYPVGYLLLWENGLASDHRIGVGETQKAPRLVIVDGQQRLTSLYAVMKGLPIVRNNYESEKIYIAFNPIEERFEVADAAIRRDKSFIPNISAIWQDETNIFEVAEKYLALLRESRVISNDEVRRIQDAISRLEKLRSFPLVALELISDISEEQVSEIFVRINSKGVSLNQADFILTLMSVFWDEGRADLEDFCRQARIPSASVDTPSPFNHFIQPGPEQLLRVGVGVAFKRARLQHVYSILRGKDLETGRFSEVHRVAQFDTLKDAQARALDIKYWHDFMQCIRTAGFRNKRMISSQNNLLFSYILYLIGRTEFEVDEGQLRMAIAQWFFMSSVTGRFSSSPESKMEFDLATLRQKTSSDQFIHQLRHVCGITLTSDFWSVTLPNDLATSSSRSPSLSAYDAALVLLDAPALFSRTSMAEYLDPAIHADNSKISRDYLFDKARLVRLGITATRETNQIANYAYVESTLDVMECLPELKAKFSRAELSRMYHVHALPSNWEDIEFSLFLEKRRIMMAEVIREGYEHLTNDTGDISTDMDVSLPELLSQPESNSVEFKSTLRTCLHTGDEDKRMETAVLKTIAAFLNTHGGTLVIGVSDDGTPIGIDADRFRSEDKMILHLENIIISRMGHLAMTFVHPHFDTFEEHRVLSVRCTQSSEPIFVKEGSSELFYVRMAASTRALMPSQIEAYLRSTHRHRL